MAPAPLTFVWPTSIAAEPDGSLLLVENGLQRVVRVQPSTGAITAVASGLAKPIAIARMSSGVVLVSDAHSLGRIDGRGRLAVVAKASADIGPIAVAKNGDVYFTTDTQVATLPRGSHRPVAIGEISGAHGIAIASDGAVLVSDTTNGRVLRIDSRNAKGAALIQIGEPRGLAVAHDGTIYVIDAVSKRVVRFTATGKRLGTFGPAFRDPYALALEGSGGAWVVDTSEAGRVVHIRRNGTASTIERR